jgi:lipopolysaccharide export system protein LptA
VRRKRAELAILLFGAAFLVLLAVFFRPGQRVAPTGRAGATPAPGTGEGSPEAGEPTTLLSGFDYTESAGEKPLFRVRSDRTIGFGAGAGLPPNLYALERVSLTVYPEEGAPVTVQSDRARYDDRTKAAVLTGNVRWVEPKDGALGETESIEFEPTKRVLRASAQLHFTRGTFDVTAASGAYDLTTRVLALDGPIRGSGTGQGSGGLSSIAGDSGEYRREEGVVVLKGRVQAFSAKGDRVAADRMVLKFSPDGNAAEWSRAFGSVRGALAPAAAGGMSRTYAADEGALFFDLSGDVRSISLKGDPAAVDEPGRRIAAQSIELDIAAGRPTSARAAGEVRVSTDRGNAEAERGSATFAPSGAFQTLDLEGSVRIDAEGRKGTAHRVVDVADRGVWILTGNARVPATVEEGGSRVSAARIEIDRTRENLAAEGKARAVFDPEKDRTPRASSFLGDPSRPTFGKGERIVLDRRARLATLSGGASLWQGSSSLFGEDITLNDAERTAVAVGKVRAVLARASGSGVARPGAKEELAVVSARRLVDRESEASAVFEDDVTVTRGSWRAAANRGVAHFGKDRKIERVELAGDVSLADRATGRTATAARATDHPNEGRTILYGDPARVADAEGNRVAGSVLTITGRGRNVEVTAPSGGRTETIHKTKSEPDRPPARP